MQKIKPMGIPIHSGVMPMSPEERQREYDRYKEIALLFLLYGDSIEGLEIPLFGEGSGGNGAPVSMDKINRDAKKIAERLRIEHQEAVDFIEKICSMKHLQRLIDDHKKQEGPGRFR
ncbi:MAG: hypothetical protein M0P64_00435 [Candidatus Pacebacteria bacterium]|nr:hypothetical protein [Candidatus Paceibacterota bacterium]